MKKLSLLLVFVMLLVMVLAINTFAASKNVAAQADLELHDSNSKFLDGSKLTDGDYNTACSAGDGPQSWINYKFHYVKEKFPNGINVAKVRVILNSTGTNANVCEYDTLSTNNFTFYIRLYDANGKSSIHNVEYKTSNNSKEFKDAEGNVLYTYFEIEFEIPKSGVYQVEVPVVNNRNKNVCLWEVEIYDYECVGEDDHMWNEATCVSSKTCKFCGKTVGEFNAENHTSIQADDGDCTTPVNCTACKVEVTPANEHRFVIDESECLNAGCRISDKEDNIAGSATITPTADESWWAVETKYIVDGNWSTACHSPKSSKFTYTFTYAEAQYLTRFIVAVNGKDFTAPRDNGNLKSSNAIKNVVINLYNVVDGEKVKVYESDRFDFDADTTEAILVLPYAIQATEATFTFNSSEQWGSSFVREIEIYKPKNIETNIASGGNPVAGGSGEVWWGVGPEYIVDGDKTTATHAPKSNDFTYTFEYAKSQLLSKVVVVANGACTTSKKVGDSDASGDHNNSAIKNVVVTLYNKSGHVIYESDRYEFTEGVTEIVIQLPYTYQASKVVVSFNSSEQWGNSFVREIEIYKTVLPNFPEGGVELDDVDFDGCWKKIKLKDAIAEAIYNKPTEDNRGTHYYAVDEDGNLILDENGNAIFITGAPIGGYSNAYGTEMDGVKETGLGIYYEGQNNGIQYNFNKQYLIKDITITYRAYCSGPNDGYDLWVGKIVNGEEVWEQVASYTASEAGYSTVKFELGEDGEGVEGSMFRFYWRAGQTARLTPTLTEVDMTLYENRCDWTVNNVLSQVSCGYDAVAECKCSRCGFEKTIVTAPATCEHNKVEITAAKAATCTDFGYNAVKQCTTCEKTFGGDRIAKSLGGHKQGTAATCTSKAICSVCNEEYGDMLAHTPDREASDCENDKICSVCKTVLEEKTGHNWVGPTCVAQKTCTNCGATEGEIGTHTEGTPATCTSKAICSVCNQEYGDFKHGELVDLKCSVCNKYVVVTRDELLLAIEKCSATEKETIVLGADIYSEYIGSNTKYIILTKPITIDFAGKTLKLGVYQNGINMKHPDCALISSVGTGTFEYIGNTTAIKIWNADKIENININVTRTASNNPITAINIQKGDTNHINYIKNVRMEGVGLSVGFETYECGASANNVIDLMENVYINATYKGASGKAQAIGLKLQGPCGTFKNCEVNSLEIGMIFRASANWSMTGTFVNCQVTGGTHGLDMYSDGNISSTAVLAFKSDENTTFTCTSNSEKSFTAALNGAIDNIEVEISGVKMVAYIDGQFYGSFEEAYAAVPNGGTLQILADVELVDSLVIDKKITLDLNKYTVTAPNGVAGDGVFHVVAGGELTIKGNGTVNGVCANEDGYHMAIWADGGKVVINGGTFTNVGAGEDAQYDLIYVKNSGSVVINGGTFIAQTPKWTLNLHGSTPGSIVVNAGSFYAYNPSASESENPVANFVVDNKCAVLNDNGYYDVINHVKGGEWLYDAENDIMVKTCVNCSKVMEKTAVVAKINGIGYASLEAAVAVGGEITLEADIDLAKAVVINNNVTINLNGKKLTVKKDTVGDGVFCVVAGGVLTINGEGTVNGVGNNNYNIAIWANGGSVVINGGTFTNVGATDENGDDHFDLIYAKNGGSVVINGGTFIAQTPKWTLNAKDNDGSTIVVNGGKFYAYNPTESASESPVVDFTSGKCAVKNSENYYVLGEHVYFNSCDARCEACGKITKEPTHNIVHVTAKAPTCTAMGNIEYWYCDICGAAWLDEALTLNTNLRAVKLPATGHSYFTQCDPVCMNCYELTNPDAAHKITHVTAVAPTCTENGNIEYWYCEYCNTAWTSEALNTPPMGIKSTTLPAAHTAADAVQENVQNATCTAAGSYESVVYCSVCEAELSRKTETVNAIGHKWTDATCTAPKTCSVCKATEGEALGHNYGTGVVNANSVIFTCTVCGTTKEIAHSKANLGETQLGYDDGAVDAVYYYIEISEVGTVTIKVDEYAGIKLGVNPEALSAQEFMTGENAYTFEMTEAGRLFIVFSLNVYEYDLPESFETSFEAAPICQHTNTEIIPAVLPLPSNNHTGKTAGLYCLDCETVVKEQVEFTVEKLAADHAFRFRAASIVLDENISVNYKPAKLDGYNNVYVVFVFEGKEYVLDEYLRIEQATSGLRYVFNFDATRPQLMASNIAAYVYAETENGYVMNCKEEYSLLEYCVTQLKGNGKDAYKAIISNALVLGAETQKIMGVNTNALVTDLAIAQGCTLNPTTFTEVRAEQNVQAIVGDRTGGTDWKAGTFRLGSSTEMVLKFETDSIENLRVKITVGGKDTYIDITEETERDGKRYVIVVDFITALQFNEKVVATFERDGKQIGSTAEYSINSYIYKNYNKENNEQEALIKALYVYGQSIYDYSRGTNNYQ